MYTLLKSINDKNKYSVYDHITNKTISFGAKGYMDYIKYSDVNPYLAEDRKELYIKRHEKNEDWGDLSKPGTWSRWILWNKPTLEESIMDMQNKFNIIIVNSLR